MKIGEILNDLNDETLDEAIPIVERFLLKLNVVDYILLVEELENLKNKKD